MLIKEEEYKNSNNEGMVKEYYGIVDDDGKEVIKATIIRNRVTLNESESEPTDTQQLMQSMTDAELRDLENQQNQELLAQQMADIELAMLGGNA
jgi:hypothetical protein